MERIINWEQWRIIAISTVSPLFGYVTPTKGFVYALVVMFALNIWAGMRADGVASMAGYEEYIAKHGTHFTDSLATWASEKMTNAQGDANHHWSEEDVKSAFERLGLKKPEESTWGDVAYSANMHYADYFGSSLKTEADCIKQAYADVSDPDGYPGKIFNRWTSDIIGKRVKVPWKNHI